MANNFCQSTRTEIFERTCGRCFYCGCKLLIENFTIDHVIPRKKGGTSGKNKKNLVAACTSCNSSKGSLSLSEYRRYVSHKNRFAEIGVNFSERQVEYLFKEGFKFGFSRVVFFGEK